MNTMKNDIIEQLSYTIPNLITWFPSNESSELNGVSVVVIGGSELHKIIIDRQNNNITMIS